MKHEELLAQMTRYYEVWREGNDLYDKWAKAHGLSMNSLLALISIYEGEGDCTQKQISQKWLIPKQTVHSILQDFEGKGYVSLGPAPRDKRNKAIRLTPAGRAYAEEILAALRQRELFAVEQMGVKRMKELNHLTALFSHYFSQAEAGDGHEADR